MATDFVSPSVVSPTAYNAPIQTFTLRDIAEQAYRMAGGLKFAGQHFNASESQEALLLTNLLIDGLKIEALLVIFLIRTLVTLAMNKKAYGVGPGQDWDIERPEKINAAGFVLNAGLKTESEIPMQVIASFEQYQGLVAKLVGSSIPIVLYYQATIPYGTATLWPVPNATTTQVALYTPGTLQQFQTMDDPVITPKGYMEMLMYNLAIRVHQRPPYNKVPMDPQVTNMANLYKDRVKYQQVTPILSASDPAVMGRSGSEYSGVPKAWVPPAFR